MSMGGGGPGGPEGPDAGLRPWLPGPGGAAPGPPGRLLQAEETREVGGGGGPMSMGGAGPGGPEGRDPEPLRPWLPGPGGGAAPGPGGGPGPAPRRCGLPASPDPPRARAGPPLRGPTSASSPDSPLSARVVWAEGSPGGNRRDLHGGRRSGGRLGPGSPATPKALVLGSRQDPRLPDAGRPPSARDAMVLRGVPESLLQKAVRCVTRGSDGRFHASIHVNSLTHAYIGSSEDVCISARMRDVAKILLFGSAADTAYDIREYDLEAVARLEWQRVGDFASNEAGIRGIAREADRAGEQAQAERRAAREGGPILPGMVAGDAFSMRGYVREHARDFTLETHPFFVGGTAGQPPSEARPPPHEASEAPEAPEAPETPGPSRAGAKTRPLPPLRQCEPFCFTKGSGRPNAWGALGLALGVPPPPDPLRSWFIPTQNAFTALASPAKTKECSQCGASKTAKWRKGPLGSKTLCNACGVKHVRQAGRAGHERKRPASSQPTAPLSLWAETSATFQCDACGKTFDKFRNFGFHCAKKGCVQSKKRWACDLCDRVFSSPGSLAMHWTKGNKNACAMEMRSRIPMDGKQS